MLSNNKSNYLQQIMLKHSILLLIPLFSSKMLSQKTDSLSANTKDNTYITYYEDAIKIRLNLSNTFNSFYIKQSETNLAFHLTPNQRIRSTLTAIYKFIEVDIGYTPEFIRFNKDDRIKGESKFFNMGATFYFSSWRQQLQYSKTKGFYVDKKELSTSENILFPDFQVIKIGGTTSYILNKNFSFRSIYIQSEWQIKSTGSFVPGISYYYTRIRNSHPSEDRIIDIAAGPAYYYNWIIDKSFLISGGAYAGLGYNQTKTVYNDASPTEMVDGLSLQTQIRGTLAYNSTRFYTGITASLNSVYYKTDPTIQVRDNQQFYEFFIGYRFNAPDKLRKITDKSLKYIKKK